MAKTMEQQHSSLGESDRFDLKEWALKARKISRENTSSRRFSASNLKSFREEARSFRSSITISSTASSPGYTLREEIDPSTYSFTTALKALQAKAVYTWEHLSPDGYTLNSKWNEAEKYISNPQSGEVPLECLSTKTLSARSFRSMTSSITMSAPLIYPSHNHHSNSLAKSPITEHENEAQATPQEKKPSTTRDVGTQSTPVELSSSSPSPGHSTPSIVESSMKLSSEAEGGDASISRGNLKSAETEVEVKETRENQNIKRNERGERKKQQMMCWCSSRQGGGCLSLRGLWTRINTPTRNKDKHKSRTNNTTTFVRHINGCSKG